MIGKHFSPERLTSLDPEPPIGGITQGGYKLTYSAKPNKMIESGSKANKRIDLRESLGSFSRTMKASTQS